MMLQCRLLLGKGCRAEKGCYKGRPNFKSANGLLQVSCFEDCLAEIDRNKVLEYSDSKSN